MADKFEVILKSGGGAGSAVQSVHELWIVDTVDATASRKVGELTFYHNVYNELSAGKKTEVNDSANTIGAIRAITTVGTITEVT